MGNACGKPNLGHTPAVVYTTQEPPPRPAPAPAPAPSPPPSKRLTPGAHSLRVQIVRGRGLARSNSERCDAYVSFQLRNSRDPYAEQLPYQTHYQTHYVPQSHSPVWNTTFTVNCSVPQDELEVRVFDYDRDHKDRPLGGFLLSLAQAELGPHWYSLQHDPATTHAGSAVAGELLISIADIGGPDDYEVRATGFRLHRVPLRGVTIGGNSSPRSSNSSISTRAGVTPYSPSSSIHGGGAAGAVAGFPPSSSSSSLSHTALVCEVDIPPSDVERNFGTARQFWNDMYDRAKDIFSPEPQAYTNRRAVELEHENLYRDGAPGATESGCIESGTDLLRLLAMLHLDEQPRFFSYVLLDDKLHFADAAAPICNQHMSKHAVHSGAKDAVRYAGEFHIRHGAGPNSTPLVVIDNNSGTYAPDPALLPMLAQLFRDICPGLEVEAREYTDPAVTEARRVIVGSAPIWQQRKRTIDPITPQELQRVYSSSLRSPVSTPNGKQTGAALHIASPLASTGTTVRVLTEYVPVTSSTPLIATSSVAAPSTPYSPSTRLSSSTGIRVLSSTTPLGPPSPVGAGSGGATVFLSGGEYLLSSPTSVIRSVSGGGGGGGSLLSSSAVIVDSPRAAGGGGVYLHPAVSSSPRILKVYGEGAGAGSVISESPRVINSSSGYLLP